MKEYTTPNMTVRIFNDLTETADPASATYVDAIRTDADMKARAQVNMTQMNNITKFTF